MYPSVNLRKQKMIQHRLRGLSSILGSPLDSEKNEELKRNKTDIENNLTKILTLIKNEDQTKREGNPKDEKKESELVGLIEDFYTQYQSLYALYDRLTGENGKIVSRRTETAGSASLSSSGSESDYFSPDELDRESNHSRRHSSASETSIKHEHQETSNVTEVKSLRDGDKDMAGSKELEEDLSRQKKGLQSLNQRKMDLQLKFESKAAEADELSAKNSELHARILELAALVKTKEVSGLEMKLQRDESHAAGNISEFMSQINTLTMEAESLRTQKDEMAAKLARSRDEALNQLDGLRIQLITMHENLDSLSYKNKELENLMEEKKESISHYLVKIEDLNEQIREEKEGFETRIKDLETELEIRYNQKRESQNELRKKIREIKQLVGENKVLQESKEGFTAKIKDLEMELEVWCNQKNGSDPLREKIHEIRQLGDENEALNESKEGFVARIKDLEMELEGRCNQKNESKKELKEKIHEIKQLGEENKALKESKEGFSSRIKDLEMELEVRCNQKNDSEKELREKIHETKQLGDLKESKECFASRIKDLEMELEVRCNQTRELEKELRGKIHEIKQLGEENKALKDRNVELERAIMHRGEEFSALVKEHESSKTGASIQATALATQVNNLKSELEALREEKNMLEQENETIQKDYSESITKIFDQGKVISEQVVSIERMSVEYEELKMWSKKFRMNPPISEKKIEELVEEVRKQLEDNIRLLYRRIRVAEQLHNETKDNYKMTKLMYEQENRQLQEIVYRYEEEEARRAGATVLNLKPRDIVSGLEAAVGKVEEESMCFVNRMEKMMEEVETARDWMKERKGEMKQLKEKLESLTALLDDKEKQEEMLREKVWKLEARVSKEGGEKLNLMKSMSQLEKKVGRLEKSLKEKDEELVNLGEMKKEAIRQLCVLNDYHRDRCDYLKDLLSKIRLAKTTRG